MAVDKAITSHSRQKKHREITLTHQVLSPWAMLQQNIQTGIASAEIVQIPLRKRKHLQHQCEAKAKLTAVQLRSSLLACQICIAMTGMELSNHGSGENSTLLFKLTRSRTHKAQISIYINNKNDFIVYLKTS